MKTHLIPDSSLRSHVRNACVVALLTALAGCSHVPLTRYTKADLNIIPVDNLPAGITAPMPVRTVVPVYPYEFKRLGIEGSAEVVCLVDENGTVRDAGCLGASVLDFAHSAVAAVRQWSFAPGTRNGTRVQMHALIPFQFVFDDAKREYATVDRISLR